MTGECKNCYNSKYVLHDYLHNGALSKTKAENKYII